MIEKNSYHDVEFIDLTHDAMGVCKIDGFPVFVKDALKGEKATIKIVKVNSNFAFGRLIEVYEESPFRKEPICEHFHTCGGCNIMHMNYEMQLSFKKHRVNETLRKIGRIDTQVNDTKGMNSPYYYRNKAIIPFGKVNDKIVAGLYKPRSHDIVNIRRCHIFPKIYSDIIRQIRSIFTQHEISIYDEDNHNGLIRAVMLRHSEKTGDISLTFIANGSKLPSKDKIMDALLERFPSISSIILNINTDRTNVMLGTKSKVLHGTDLLTDTLLGIEYEFSHGAFFQVNPTQTEVLYEKAIDYAGLKKSDVIIDAYCGIGTIALSAASHVKEVIGFDSIKENIKNASANAKRNDITNATFMTGKAETVLPSLSDRKIDAIFIDPPRKGCDKEFLKTLLSMGVRRIVYISCNVSTFARDANILTKGGYTVKEVTPFDMFPQTAHIETVALLEKI